MKKVAFYVFGAIGVFILIFTLKVVSVYFFNKIETHGLTEIGPKVDVLIVDTPNHTPEELVKDLQEGKADLLMWIEEEQGEKQAYAFNTLESLVRLEKGSLGFLDSDDPDLQGLNIAHYDETKKILYYMSAKSANISAIEVNRNYLIGEVLSDPQNYKMRAGMVIFTDGTKKELRMIKVPEAQIEHAKLHLLTQQETT
jgi:hypothetical protein